MTGHLDETTVAQLVAGELGTTDAELAQAHAAACAECRQFVAELARVAVTAESTAAEPPPAAELLRGATVGRFIVLGRIGAGGMGAVHAAYDPELDRRVALKLLHARSGADSDARARLLREAQAAARLAHPNVVSVFDIGVYEDRVYLAMELVDGVTLTEWLRGEHSWQDIVGVFVQAGRGIAGAHEAGVIHRDFKPDNVLLGRDGRARVVDFGLARAADAEPVMAAPRHDADPDETQPAARGLSSRLTRTGSLLGTPRYMAPEQFGGGEITPATDQFGFCVALYQALYRTPPFSGDRVADIATSVLAGDVVPPAVNRGPSRLRRVVVRGLAVDPAQRHASMNALLRELERARGVRRRWTIAIAVTVASAVVAGAFALAAWRGSDAPACDMGASRLAMVWNAERQARVRAAFEAQRLPYSELAWRGVAERLDTYAAAWATARDEACVATYVHHDQSPQLLDQQIACLDERRAELDAFVGALEAADAETVQHAVEGADRLSAVAACTDRAALTALVRPPDVAIAGRVGAVSAVLAKAQALARLGKLQSALAATEEACKGVDALAYPPLAARCRYMVGIDVENATGDHARAAAALADAVALAISGNDYARAGDAAIALARIVGESQDRYDEAERWIALAGGVAARLADRRELDADIAGLRGILATRRGRNAEALAQLERLLVIREHLESRRGLDVAYAHIDIGHALVGLGRLPEAETHYRRALAIIEEVAGTQHPDLGPVLDGLAQLEFSRNRPRAALPYLERAAAIARSSLPVGHPSRVLTLANLGAALTNTGELDRALAVLEEARATVAATDRRQHAQVLTNLVSVYQRRGDHARALELALEALAAERAVRGDEHPDTARAQFNVGDTLLSNGRPREAITAIRAALAVWERTLPADHPYFATARTALGDALLRTGDARGAIPVLETVHDEPEASFLLARALWESGTDRVRARTLAATTAAALRRDPDADKALVAQVDKWLATH